VWAAFTIAGFTVEIAGDQAICVRPAPPGTALGPFPFAAPVTFLTADNPHGRTVPEAENDARRTALAALLDDLGLDWLPATGGDPQGDHLEPGAAIVGLDAAAATELGVRFDQAAIYRWEPEALHLVACAGDRHEVLGYTAVPLPSG